MESKRIRVLIVDDSPFMQQALQTMLLSDPVIDVVGIAANGREAYDMAISLRPDVVTMDLQMPVMDGVEAIENIMTQQPLPIIVVSSLNPKAVAHALSIGALDFISISEDMEKLAGELLEKVHIAVKVKPIRRLSIPQPVPPKSFAFKQNFRVAAVGVSTGGPQALKVLLSSLPAGFPLSVLVVQHITDGFIQGLADWLNESSPLAVRVARNGDVVKAGSVWLAPDACHMQVAQDFRIHLVGAEPPMLVHVPSIDVMMQSVAAVYGNAAMGIIMTGMGRDGVDGIGRIKAAGGTTIAQDEETSAVFGMNKEAIAAGHIDHVVALPEIGLMMQGLIT